MLLCCYTNTIGDMRCHVSKDQFCLTREFICVIGTNKNKISWLKELVFDLMTKTYSSHMRDYEFETHKMNKFSIIYIEI